MSKVFVIKNKEGKYFVNRYVQAKKIYNAFIFEDKNDAEQLKGKDDEVVEITIAEGNLEEEIRKRVCDEIKELLKMHCEYTEEEYIGWYLPENKIDLLINKVEKTEK